MLTEKEVINKGVTVKPMQSKLPANEELLIMASSSSVE